MSSLVIDMILCGIAYVLLIYFIATMNKPPFNSDKNNNGDDGDGGIEDTTPPKIDLPPGVIWPSEGPKSKKPTSPMEV
ncbi:hypothetical protein IFO69_08555 [Echinicola sp. CAU 1574]|uniref:ATP synthase F0 subunit 8 n=1 Tax=Echinicola arenosa TaxID=2774144 RepID=A0ABR9ALT3_9BACT|nr:hypothetical protein [Echinicola arenosa]MBD8488793.1 hypothetical protein [Echinicola arenosa]